MPHIDPSLTAAIQEPISLLPYDPTWPTLFAHEQSRLSTLFPHPLHHIGSTAVPGLPAKPIIDCLAPVTSMQVADALIPLLCAHGYTTSPAYNESLVTRRWLMRQTAGRRTHHLHLVLPDSPHFTDPIRFRDALRCDPALAARYAQLKYDLAAAHPTDREAYTTAKTAFITAVLQAAP